MKLEDFSTEELKDEYFRRRDIEWKESEAQKEPNARIAFKAAFDAIVGATKDDADEFITPILRGAKAIVEVVNFNDSDDPAWILCSAFAASDSVIPTIDGWHPYCRAGRRLLDLCRVLIGMQLSEDLNTTFDPAWDLYMPRDAKAVDALAAIATRRATKIEG